MPKDTDNPYLTNARAQSFKAGRAAAREKRQALRSVDAETRRIACRQVGLTYRRDVVMTRTDGLHIVGTICLPEPPALRDSSRWEFDAPPGVLCR